MLTKRLTAVYRPHFPPDLPALPSGRLRPRLPPDLPVRLFQKPCPTGRALILSADCFLLAIIFLLLSERERCSYRTSRPACFFRAHFNLWWARHGWPLIHLVARPDGRFSRPPYFTAGVNLTAESAIEPPRGGEHDAGATCLNRKTPFAESRN